MCLLKIVNAIHIISDRKHAVLIFNHIFIRKVAQLKKMKFSQKSRITVLCIKEENVWICFCLKFVYNQTELSSKKFIEIFSHETEVFKNSDAIKDKRTLVLKLMKSSFNNRLFSTFYIRSY